MNTKGIPLITIVRLLNESKMFPIALSYCLGEDITSYEFFIESLFSEIFCKGVPGLRVVLLDRSSGMAAAVDRGALRGRFH